jgi:multidrug efflux pump subunit AcrA (membrane-fusion protein)
MYCRVVLTVQRRPQVLTIPIQAVPPGLTNNVYVVNDQHQIEERPVTLGLDTPDEYEVTAGLKEGELVLVGSRSQVQPGQKVEPKLDGSLAAE